MLKRVWAVLITVALLVSPLHLPLSMASCRPEVKEKLTRSIVKIRRFVEQSRQSPSFNYDRLEFLLKKFDSREKMWASCGDPNRSLQDKVLHHRLHILRERLAQSRAMLPGSAPVPVSALSNIDDLFLDLPKSPRPGTRNPSEPVNRSGSSRKDQINPMHLLLGIFLLGIIILVTVFRRTTRRHRGPMSKQSLFDEMHQIGTQWIKNRQGRSEILAAMKSILARRHQGVIQIRAQLIKKDLERNEWKVVDEVVDDEGGIIRTFKESPPEQPLQESLSEIPLGDGEIRTRMVLPLSDSEGEEMAVVVDSLSAPDIVFLLSDPSGLRSHHLMKEALFEASIGSQGEAERGSVGVLSFFFEDQDKRSLLESDLEEAMRDKEFIVGEVSRMSAPPLLVFGEAPGMFHLIISGSSEAQVGSLIRKIAEGFGPGSDMTSTQLLERPWFQKVLVAYTRWREPHPDCIDHFLSQIHENLDKLVANPNIRTVIDT